MMGTDWKMNEMRSDMWNIRLTAREAVHGQHHPQQRDLLEVMNSFSHFGDAAPAGKINRRISQPITSLAAASSFLWKSHHQPSTPVTYPERCCS
ncbi:uncharacterized protein ACWYII_018504 isoform 4-T4 [Salvelinus alpinus]